MMTTDTQCWVLPDPDRRGAIPARTGSDFLMDGGVTAAYGFGDLAPR